MKEFGKWLIEQSKTNRVMEDYYRDCGYDSPTENNKEYEVAFTCTVCESPYRIETLGSNYLGKNICIHCLEELAKHYGQ